MIAEIRKALTVKKHPGMGSTLTLPRLISHALPFGLSPSGMARPPLTVYWSVNSVCNLYCKMCDVGNPAPGSNFFKNLKIDGKLKEIRIERFKSVIDEVAPFRPMISITSTEPLMYKPLAEAIGYTRSRGLDIAITTGGYTLPQKAEELVEAGLTRLNVSLDGPPELHNQIRGRKDSFQRSLEGIGKAKEAAARKGQPLEVLVNYTISNLNYGALEGLLDALAPHPVDRINYTYMTYVNQEMADTHNRNWASKYHATVNCLNDHTDPRKVDVDVLLQQIEAVKAKGGSKVTVLPDFGREELARYFHEPMKFMGAQRCMVSWFIAEIIATGEVIPYTRCYNVSFGNINEHPFLDIWNGARMRDWRKELRWEARFPACTRCDQCY